MNLYSHDYCISNLLLLYKIVYLKKSSSLLNHFILTYFLNLAGQRSVIKCIYNILIRNLFTYGKCSNSCRSRHEVKQYFFGTTKKQLWKQKYFHEICAENLQTLHVFKSGTLVRCRRRDRRPSSRQQKLSQHSG